jgi:hypothetical protein
MEVRNARTLIGGIEAFERRAIAWKRAAQAVLHHNQAFSKTVVRRSSTGDPILSACSIAAKIYYVRGKRANEGDAGAQLNPSLPFFSIGDPPDTTCKLCHDPCDLR